MDQDDAASISAAASPNFTRSMYGKMMKRIHNTHKEGQSIRNVLLPVLLADRRNYAAALAQFYFPTALLEDLLPLYAADPVIAGILSLNTSFKNEYAADLEELLGKNWLEVAQQMRKPATLAYLVRLHEANAQKDTLALTAAYFILHGPLVVGGGPALKPFVKSVFGDRCVNVLDVKDRNEVKKAFKAFFNKEVQLLVVDEEKLLAKCASFMSLNNLLLTQLDFMPRSMYMWLPTAILGTAAFASIVYYLRSRQK